MIRHSVVLKLKHKSGSPEEMEFLNESWKLKSIPGVMKFEVMKEISSGNPYEFGISMDLKISRGRISIPINQIILDL